MWMIALAIAALGIVAAVAMGSWLPLIACAGLALPMLPVGTVRSGRDRSVPR